MPTTRVALLSAVRLYREGVASILRECPDFELCLEADPRETKAEMLRELRLRVVVIGIDPRTPRDLPGRIREACPDVVLVAFAVEERAEEILACAEAGVEAFVAADGTRDDLVRGIRAALAGELVCSARSASIMFRQLRRLAPHARDADALGSLTLRERQVLELVDRGLSNKEIASYLHIQLPTVKNHVHQILEKLDAQSRTEAAAHLHRGLIEA